MGKKVLIVVDMQNDFVTGALGSEQAVAILPNVVKEIRNFKGDVYFTLDTHGENYMETQEGRMLPVKHCLENSDGWKLTAELEVLCNERQAKVFAKRTFGSVQLAEELKRQNDAQPLESIELIGVCTDICVVSNALLLKAFMPEVKISVNADCCAGVTGKKHEAALETMRSCQIEVVSETLD